MGTRDREDIDLHITAYIVIYVVLISGWYTYPLKNIGQLGLLFPIYGKNNVPNHQPVIETCQYASLVFVQPLISAMSNLGKTSLDWLATVSAP